MVIVFRFEMVDRSVKRSDSGDANFYILLQKERDFIIRGLRRADLKLYLPMLSSSARSRQPDKTREDRNCHL